MKPIKPIEPIQLFFSLRKEFIQHRHDRLGERRQPRPGLGQVFIRTVRVPRGRSPRFVVYRPGIVST